MQRGASYALMVFVATSIAYFAAVTFLDPTTRLLHRTPRPTPEAVAAQLTANGLDPTASPPARYLDWLRRVVFHFDWGLGPDGSRVNDEFFARALVSGRLVALATLLSIVIGIALGVYAASRQYTPADRAVTGLGYLLSTVPAAVVYLVVQLGGIRINEWAGATLFYVSGISSPVPPPTAWGRLVDLAQHLFLPTLALTLLACTSYLLLQRTLLLDEIGTDYVRTARAKGLTRTQAVRRHALRTSFIPVAQSIAFTIPAIFTGTFVIEHVFAWPGLAVYTLEAITTTQDVNATVAGVAFGGVVFAVGAALADLSVAVADPRVRVPVT